MRQSPNRRDMMIDAWTLGRMGRAAAGALVGLAALIGPACSVESGAPDAGQETSEMPDAAAYVESIDAWHAGRVARLTDSEGWLTLVGLTWLDEGRSAVGRGPSCVVQHDGFPVEDVGTIVRAGDVIRFEPAPGAPVTGVPAGGVMLADDSGDPTVLVVGTCRFHVIRRGERYGVRLKDEAAAARRTFAGIDRFPVDPAWRVSARWIPAPPDTVTPVELIIGTTIEEPVAGRAAFVHDGAEVSLVLTPTSDPSRLFVVFGDTTNGATTYGGGRFLEAVLEGDTVILDFNRAYNPPCALTPFATCPMPGPDNRLPFVVAAGEKHPG